MFMPKRPLSITLDEDNLLWIRGRAAAGRRRSLSDTLDEIVTAARTGGHGASASRSVSGTVDIPETDANLEEADAFIRSAYDASLSRPSLVREPRAGYGRPATARRVHKAARRG